MSASRFRAHRHSGFFAGLWLLAVVAMLMAATPLAAFSVGDHYRVMNAAYIQEGFTYTEPSLPYTERTYPPEPGAYDEQGFGYMKPFLPYTVPTDRIQSEAYYLRVGSGYLR